MNIFKKIATLAATTLVASVLIAGLSNPVLACGGSDCGGYSNPPQNQQPPTQVSGELGVWVNTNGSNFGGASSNQVGNFEGYSISESFAESFAGMSVANDLATNCNECGKNLAELSVKTGNRESVGVKLSVDSVSIPANTPVFVQGESRANSDLTGSGFVKTFGGKK